MAAGTTQIADVVVPEVFTPYTQQLTEDKNRIVESGALSRDGAMDAALSGGGLTFSVPSYKDLDDEDDNVSTDTIADVIAATAGGTFPNPRGDASPKKIGSATEVAVRLSRNQLWSAMDLAAALAGKDPMMAIAARVAKYWSRRMQAAFIATWQGVFKDNAANDSGDYANDVAGAVFAEGVTNFTAEAFIDAMLTLGDSADGEGSPGLVFCHSFVFARMKKNNLIDFIPDARGETQISTYQGKLVLVDDHLPSSTNVVRKSGAAGDSGCFDTWIFGAGSTRLGVATPKVATVVAREERAGNGGGQEVLHNRVQWAIHPVGHAWSGTAASGGPGNGTGANQLNAAASWNRVFAERKQIKVVRLITREFS